MFYFYWIIAVIILINIINGNNKVLEIPISQIKKGLSLHCSNTEHKTVRVVKSTYNVEEQKESWYDNGKCPNRVTAYTNIPLFIETASVGELCIVGKNK